MEYPDRGNSGKPDGEQFSMKEILHEVLDAKADLNITNSYYENMLSGIMQESKNGPSFSSFHGLVTS